MVVVLPAPFGPRKPNTSPRWTSKLTPASESFGAFGYRLTRSATSTASGSGLSVFGSLFNCAQLAGSPSRPRDGQPCRGRVLP